MGGSSVRLPKNPSVANGWNKLFAKKFLKSERLLAGAATVAGTADAVK